MFWDADLMKFNKTFANGFGIMFLDIIPNFLGGITYGYDTDEE